MGVDKSGLITGRVDAITPLEQFEPVWQEIEGISKVTLLMKYVQNLILYNFRNYVLYEFYSQVLLLGLWTAFVLARLAQGKETGIEREHIGPIAKLEPGQTWS